MLLATLNRLEGEDIPAKRAELLAELAALMPVDELASLLPEDSAAIDETLALLDVDAEALMTELSAAVGDGPADLPRTLSFAVLPEDESTIKRAVDTAGDGPDGQNRRGRALAAICRAYLEGRDD